MADESENSQSDDVAVEADADPAAEPEIASEQLRDGTRRERNFLLTICSVFLVILAYQYLSLALKKPEPLPWKPGESAQLFRVDVNTGTWIEWSQLQGIGPSLAHRIVADRSANGPFQTIDDVQRVHGIGPMTLDRIRPWLTITLESATPPSQTD